MVVDTLNPQTEALDWDQDDLFQEAAEVANFWDERKYVFKTASIKRATGGNPEFGPSNEWLFEVFNEDGSVAKVLEDGTPADFKQYISTKMTPGSTGRPLIEAILGRKLSDGDKPSGSEIIGKPFFGFILYEVPRGKTDGVKKAKLKNASPYRSQRGAAPAQQRRPAPPQPVADLDDLPF